MILSRIRDKLFFYEQSKKKLKTRFIARIAKSTLVNMCHV